MYNGAAGRCSGVVWLCGVGGVGSVRYCWLTYACVCVCVDVKDVKYVINYDFPKNIEVGNVDSAGENSADATRLGLCTSYWSYRSWWCHRHLHYLFHHGECETST
jgi:hypothetical protein